MPYLLSLFSLLIIASIMTWSYTARSMDLIWNKQLILFTKRVQKQIFEDIQNEEALQNYTRRLPLQQEIDKNQDEKKENTKKERFITRIDSMQKEKRNQKACSKYLHIASLFDLSVTSDDTVSKAAFFLLKRLSAVLFAQQLFYQQMTTGPGFEGIDPETLLRSIVELGRKMKETKKPFKIQYPDDLANLSMSNHNEQYLLYKFLRGGGAGEVDAEGSYESLLKYIRFDKRNTILNVYLAPIPLLLALFNDVDVVERVCEYRHELYKKYNREREKKEELQREFQSQFSSLLPQEIDPSTIDFNISLTQPGDEL